ncbi:hypothetical protein [Olivibacter sitiensis]|uniref:hypothetical protein n=1 Tax=Olivibacter sitiensis TaxID=376470 RepID=UPI00048082A1|nr:hypothetical protein [Olivibacter sitiensis]
METKQVLRIYLILSVIISFLFPFTGLIALVNAIRANRAGLTKTDEIKKHLNNSYKWIIITVTVFVLVYLLFISFFILTNLMLKR